MNPHMKDRDWRQYLDTYPTGDPTAWLTEILAAFKAQWIDYADAHVTVSQYVEAHPEWQPIAGPFYTLIQKEEVKQDTGRALIYLEQEKIKKQFQ
jgi:hypothetical protein